MLDQCITFSGFQNSINFDFSPKIGQDMVKHKKMVWGAVLHKTDQMYVKSALQIQTIGAALKETP
jgi:hypothetical protein